jgi:Ca2+/Na+ antiporter
MAAVEKRKTPFLALLGNHLMFSVLCLFIVVPLSGNFKFWYGIFFLSLYLFGIYGYAEKTAIEQTKSYSTTNPSFKYPIAYGLIAVLYFLLPIVLFSFIKYGEIMLLIVFIDSPFMFSDLLFDGKINYQTVLIFSLIIMAFPILGYFFGKIGFSPMSKINRLLYRKPKK